MASLEQRSRKVDESRFGMTPRSDVPRSTFRMQHSHKTTFDGGYLVPFYLEEVLPGDSFRSRVTVFARMATPLYPVMDNLYLESFFFFVPSRILWAKWKRFMGEQTAVSGGPVILPTVASPATGWAVGSIGDYFGLPTVGSPQSAAISVNALPFRAYNLVFNEWFRDENLVAEAADNTATDGPDVAGGYVLQRRAKRPDYFTTSLPWPQKGTAASFGLTGQAPVTGIGIPTGASAGTAGDYKETDGDLHSYTYARNVWDSAVGNQVFIRMQAASTYPDIWADLTAAGSVTINAFRQAFAMQAFLEKDARGGTRYNELILSHFGVRVPDYRLQRPEFLGGGRSMVNVTPIAQSSATGLTGGSSPLGQLGGAAVAVGEHRWSGTFSEHGYVLGIANVRADLTYQYGVHRMWTRSSRYDFYWPIFAQLGEQEVRRREIYATGVSANDNAVFGYQERYGEYRYRASMVTSKFRGYVAGTLDSWHLAQRFAAAPTLSAAFIQDAPPVDRVVAAGSAADGQQFLLDAFFETTAVRAIPAFGVPGLVGRF